MTRISASGEGRCDDGCEAAKNDLCESTKSDSACSRASSTHQSVPEIATLGRRQKKDNSQANRKIPSLLGAKVTLTSHNRKGRAFVFFFFYYYFLFAAERSILSDGWFFSSFASDLIGSKTA